MTGDEELDIGKPIDGDYIDVEKRRADVSESGEKDDNIERSREAAEHQKHDKSSFFDFGNGSGAASDVDELIDENAIIEHDGRASTRTFFYPGEAPERQKKRYRRMIQYQEDKWSGMKNAQRAADRRRTVDTFCGRLDMTEYHRERVKYVMEGINMSHMAHYSSQKVILAIISLVANEDDRFIRDEASFRDLMDDVGSTLGELKRIRGLIRKKSERL